MSLQFSEITPALYGISAIYAWRAMTERWDDLIAPILKTEDQVYDTSFRSYVAAGLMNGGEPSAFNAFRELWLNKKGAFWRNEECDRAMTWVFHEYWGIAARKAYWRDGEFRRVGGWLAYQEALAKWQGDNQDLIVARKSEFEAWKNSN